MKRYRTLFKIFVLTLFFVFVGCKGGGLTNSKVEAQVIKVIDGDTIIVRIPETTFNKNQATLRNLRFTVRLLGIDTPESRENRRARLQARELNTTVRIVVFLGKKAKGFTERLLLLGKKGKRKIYKKVYLEFDKQPQDRYGRLLAYVWLPDGKMLNKEIICNGYALPLTIKPNTKYSKEFLECYKKAVENHLGLWQRP